MATQVEDAAASVEGPTYTPRTFVARKPAPAKPATQTAAQRKMELQASPMFPEKLVHFVERPGRRKVKYGQNR